ncbi:MAG: membrane dipeptidase [Clostridia bacterium]|nr:membrane dipeptidase [Clostridia bacterium]
MLRLSFFDLHSDTVTALYYDKKSFYENDLHISLDKITEYEHYGQIFAIFTKSALSDEEGYLAFSSVAEFFHKLIFEHSDRIAYSQSSADLSNAWMNGRAAAFLAVEDARILAGKLERLQHMYDYGVRFLTLLWAGETCIGGSWDMVSGLTDFGKDVVRECFRLGIVPDVSHASVASTDDVIELASAYHRPIVATHSDAFSVYGHGRNLADRHFEAIKATGGLVGINLYKHHLCDESLSLADAETVYRHIEHYMSLGGEDTVSFGCDFDGAEFPETFKDISSVLSLSEVLLRHNYPEHLVRKIFYENVVSFIKRTFPA